MGSFRLVQVKTRSAERGCAVQRFLSVLLQDKAKKACWALLCGTYPECYPGMLSRNAAHGPASRVPGALCLPHKRPAIAWDFRTKGGRSLPEL